MMKTTAQKSSLPETAATKTAFKTLINSLRKPAVAYGISFGLGLILLINLDWPDPEKYKSQPANVSISHSDSQEKDAPQTTAAKIEPRGIEPVND